MMFDFLIGHCARKMQRSPFPSSGELRLRRRQRIVRHTVAATLDEAQRKCADQAERLENRV